MNYCNRALVLLICNCCCQVLKKPVLLRCSHYFCEACFKMFIELCVKVSCQVYCPECHADLPVSPLNTTWLVHPKGISNMLSTMSKTEKCFSCPKKVSFCCIDCKIAICEDCAAAHTDKNCQYHLIVNYEDYKKTYCFNHILAKSYHSRTSHLLLCAACMIDHPDQTFEKLPQDSSFIHAEYESCIAFIQSAFPENQLFVILESQGKPFKVLQYFFKLLSCKPKQLKTEVDENSSHLHTIERFGDSVTFFSEKGEKVQQVSTGFKIMRWSVSTELENGDILITGGKNDKDKGSCKTFYLIAKATQAVIKGEMIFPHSSHPAVLAPGSKVYILGGKDQNNISNTHCEVFDTQTQTRTVIASMVVGRTCAAGVYSLENLFVLGGFSSSFTNSIEKYCIQLDQWSLLRTTLPVKLFQPGAVRVDDQQVLVFGGEVSTEYKNCKSFIFNTLTENFGLCRNMKVKDSFLGFWYHSKIIGFKAMTVNTKHLLEFDLKTTRWERFKLKVE